MWPFKRQFPDLADEPDNSWAVARGSREGGPIAIRYNNWALRLRGHPDYTHQVGVAIPFHNEDGAPSEPSMDRLSAFEDVLSGTLRRAPESAFVAVITTARMREFVFYTSNSEATKAKLEVLRDATKDLVVEFIIQHDPKWKVFSALLP